MLTRLPLTSTLTGLRFRFPSPSTIHSSLFEELIDSDLPLSAPLLLLPTLLGLVFLEADVASLSEDAPCPESWSVGI